MVNKFKKGFNLINDIINYNFVRYFKPLKPVEMQINITYLCNSHCQMCQIWKAKPRNELKVREWNKILKDPIFKSIERLSIAGGEPMLHPEAINLTILFIKSMPKLNNLAITTNGFLSYKTVNYVKKISEICKTKNIFFSVSVSIDGVGKVHDEARDIPNAFKKASQTAIMLNRIKKKYNFYLGISGVIMKKNLYKIKKLEQWCKNRNIPFSCQIVGFHKTYLNNINKKKELGFLNKDKKCLFLLLTKLSKQKTKNLQGFLRMFYWHDLLKMYKFNKERKVPCPFLLDAFVLDSLGDVYYCLSEKKIGNCRKDNNVSQIYFDPINLKRRKQMSKSACLRCNSGCFVASAIAKDFKKFAWFFLMSKILRIK